MNFSFNKKSTPAPAFSMQTNQTPQQSNFMMGGMQNNQLVQQSNPISTILQSYKYILQDNTNRDNSVFNCVVFNYVEPGLREEFLKDEANRSLYTTYLKENPDPENMVPMYIYGFEGLKKRIEEQRGVILKVEAGIKTLQDAIQTLRQYESSNEILVQQVNRQQQELEEKMICVLGKLEMKVIKSQMVSSNDAYLQKLTELRSQVSDPQYPLCAACVGFLIGRTGLLNRLSAIYSSLNTYGISLPKETMQLNNADAIASYLDNQESALEKLVHLLKQSQRELELIANDPYISLSS